jgi:hypothetical protein
MKSLSDVRDIYKLKLYRRYFDYLIHRNSTKLTDLPNDILIKEIYMQLSKEDRISFVFALTVNRKQWIKAYEFNETYLVDIFHQQLSVAIRALSDNALYTSASNMVFADWSAFGGSRNKVPLAHIFWSYEPPHLRVDLDFKAIGSCARRSVKRKTKHVRLTVHEILTPDHISVSPLVPDRDLTIFATKNRVDLLKWMPHTVIDHRFEGIAF